MECVKKQKESFNLNLETITEFGQEQQLNKICIFYSPGVYPTYSIPQVGLNTAWWHR